MRFFLLAGVGASCIMSYSLLIGPVDWGSYCLGILTMFCMGLLEAMRA